MTVARWQRAGMALQVLLVALALAWCARQGWGTLAVGVALVPLWLRLPLALQFAAAWRAVRGPAPRPGARQWLRAWWAEGTWAGRVFGWWQPWRADALADGLRAARPGRGVVLVHGWGCNRGFWTPWLRRLRHEGRVCVAVSLEPPLGSIDAYAPAIDAAVRAVMEATGMPPLIVAHSMGGLAVRAWLHAVPDADAHVQRIVTLATPHQGTAAARWAFSVNTRQMRPDSRWLRTLAASEPPARRARFDCWQSDCDNVVYPLGAALLPGAQAHTLAGLGHVELAFDPRVVQACWALLDGD
ncbi:MAG: alpha/beta hydrolase [Burkholderiales bacterium]|nr:alpha/beta hydrolase [Burkholderiales bacterium]